MKRNHTRKFSTREIRIINKRNTRSINRNPDTAFKRIKRNKSKNLNNIPETNFVSVKKPVSKKYNFVGNYQELNLSTFEIKLIKRFEKKYNISYKYSEEDFKKFNRRSKVGRGF